MGSVTEQLTATQIVERYGRVTTLLPPESGTFADGRLAGELTDDGLLTIEVARALVRGQGTVTETAVAEMLVAWAGDPELFARFAGPSTRRAIELLRAGTPPAVAGAAEPLKNDLRSSNGAAMKVSPAGWVAPGDIERAVELACVLSVPTHNSSVAFAGASAVAAAVSAAAVGRDPHGIAQAAVDGAERGDQLGKERGVEVPGPSVAARLELAADIALGGGTALERVDRLTALFGCGLPISEAVPMSVGLALVYPTDAMSAVIDAVNTGGDTDTIAAIAGAIVGTAVGLDGVDQPMVRALEEANSLDVRAEAQAIVDVSGGMS